MNVLIIFSDQQHKYALGSVTPQFHTPNLDTLCEEGFLFENAYSPNPVCGPYRGCLLTGAYTSHCGVFRNGDPLPTHMPSLAALLQQNGYETGFVGKWHLGDHVSAPIPVSLRGGFAHFRGYQCHNGFEPKAPFNNDVTFYDEQETPHRYDKHRTEVTTDLAVEQLTTLVASGKPFFQLVSYQAPHYPEQPSAPFDTLYDGVTFPKSPDYQPVEPFTPTYSPPSPRPFEKDPDYQRYGGNMDAYQRLYAGMVSQVDAGVGRLLDALRQLGIYEDTLILFTSDHGDMQGSHGLKNKNVSYEQSCGVPFLVRYPGGPRGIRSAELVSALDIFPTVTELAGLPQIPCDGRSLLPLLQQKAYPSAPYVIAEGTDFPTSDRRWRMIRDTRYKLTVSYDTYEPFSLFDLEADPHEMQDLKCCPDLAPQIQAMTRQLQSVMEPFSLEDPQFATVTS